MRTTIFKFICSVFYLSIVIGCYEDKGNYDYLKISDIKIQLPNEVVVMFAEPLKIEPIIDFATSSQEDYTYKWEIATHMDNNANRYKCISEDKNLLMEHVELDVLSYRVRFTMTHKRYNHSVNQYMNLIVDNGISNAILLLTKNNTYDLDAIRYTDGKIFKALYSQFNGRKLDEGKALRYINVAHTSDEKLYIYKNNGGETVSSVDLRRQNEASDWFFERPSVIDIQNWFADKAGRDQYIVNQGKVHYLNNVETPLKATLPCVVPSSEYFVAGSAGMFNKSGLGRYLFFDSMNNRFLEWKFGYGENFLGLLKAPVGNTYFDPQEIEGRLVRTIWQNSPTAYFLFENAKKELILYSFKDGAEIYYNLSIVPERAPVTLDSQVKQQFISSEAMIPFINHNKIYYAFENGIYEYNVTLNQTISSPIFSFEDVSERVVKMFTQQGDKNELWVATNSDQGRVYRIELNEDGLVAKDESGNAKVAKYQGFDPIVDMIYKRKQY